MVTMAGVGRRRTRPQTKVALQGGGVGTQCVQEVPPIVKYKNWYMRRLRNITCEMGEIGWGFFTNQYLHYESIKKTNRYITPTVSRSESVEPKTMFDRQCVIMTIPFQATQRS